MNKTIKHFLSISDFSSSELLSLLNTSVKLKKLYKKAPKEFSVLEQNTLAMIFEKPSLRTRLSFEIAMTQLGGHAIYLGPNEIGLGKRESIADIAKVTSGMSNIIMARTFKHSDIEILAENSSVPVINALSDLEHPCQILADLMTIIEIKGGVKGLKVAYVGDGENNVTHSLCLGILMLGGTFNCGSPNGYWMHKDIVKKAKSLSINVLQTTDPREAVAQADVVVTDTWVSMGDEAEKSKRITDLKDYQVNSKLMKLAKNDSIFMHCLPAYRGNEVSTEVIDGTKSVVFQEAENRLHSQKALILKLLNKKII